MIIRINILKRADAQALGDINGLLAQVRSISSERKGTIAELKNLTVDKKATVVVAKDGERIIGMAFLFVIAHIGRKTGQVEDVVVDAKYRGKGIGKMLMQKLIVEARKKKLKKLFLTSRPARVAGNALYQSVGFEKKETNVYCLEF